MPATATDRMAGLTTSVAVKAPVKSVSTANLTLSGEQTVNSVALVEGDRVLVMHQTTASENGIYTVSTGSWTRAKDFDGNRDVVQGTRVLVAMPNSAHAAEYEVTTANPITIGTTSLTFVLRYGANATYDQTAAEIAAGVTPTNYFYAPGNILRYNADSSGVSNSDTAVDAAQDAGYQPYAPRGTYLFSSTIAVKAPGFRGDGPNLTKLKFVGVDAFTLASDEGLNRPSCVLEGFSVDASTSTNCDGKYFFYAPGVAAAAAAVYNSGITIRDVEVGRTNRFGGGLYIKDCFRLNVENVGFTDVSWMIRIVGSVVQAKFRNITSNNDSAGTTLSKYGISTESASYASGTLTPENLRFIDCSYIRGERGISHAAGLLIEFHNFDTEVTHYGAHVNAAVTMRGGILAPSSTASAWVGIFRGVSISDDDDGTIFDGVDINCLNTPATPASSYGIDAGDGVSPVRGLVVKHCRFRGSANSLASAFRGRVLNDCTFEDNFIRTAVVNGTNDVSASGERLFFRRNRNDSGVWSITDAGSATAYGEVMHNKITTLTSTFTTRANWRADVNEAIVRRRRGVASIGDGGTIAHGLSSTPTYFQATATQSGEFASVTSVDGTNLTVAIKTHAGAAGATQNIHWEAEY